MKKVCWLTMVLILVLVMTVSIFGCKSPSTTGTQTTTTSNTPKQTIKIGFISALSRPPGFSWVKQIQLIAEVINKEGGLDVGGVKYLLEVIPYDNNDDQSQDVAAANRLVFEDKVNFISGDAIESILPITEPNKVIVSGISPIPTSMTPDKHYTFMTNFTNSAMIITGKWFMNKYPDVKSVTMVLPDMQLGRIIGGFTVATLSGLGMNISPEYYPPAQTDLSSLGSKIKSLNPDAVLVATLDPIKPIRDSGWDGIIFCQQPYAMDELLAMATPEALEGFIGLGVATEFEPALTDVAEAFKQDYIAKYSKWESMDMAGATMIWAVLAAMQKAGTVDPDAVAAVMSAGMAWESPQGSHLMVARPDLGNDRTVDSVSSFYMKQIIDGKAVLIDTITLEVAESSYSEYLKTAPPPSGPPAH
ncbi:MAG: ABC transporter substrate-binding protein [Dehalococcoidales bacterium]|nr:ABC transporter substrate-binding protein [Dehalococcoidales bacterium]